MTEELSLETFNLLEIILQVLKYEIAYHVLKQRLGVQLKMVQMLNTPKTRKRHNGNLIIYLNDSPEPLTTFIGHMSGNAFSLKIKKCNLDGSYDNLYY